MGKIYSVKDSNSIIRDTVSKKKEDSTSLFSRRISSNENNTLTIDFSAKLMIFIILTLGFIFYTKQLLTIIMFVFFAFVIMSSLRPIVNWFSQKGISKGWSVAITYLLLFLLIQSILIIVFVPFANQLAGLVSELPKWLDDSLAYLRDLSIGGHSLDINFISQYITDFVKTFPTADNFKNIATFVSDFFGLGAFLVTAIIFSVYLVLEHDTFSDILLIRIVSDEKRERVKKLIVDMERKLGNWVLGQAVLSSLVAIFSGIILTILNVPFALPLAIFTGLIGVIPSLGSTIAGVIMAVVTLITAGPIGALVLLGAFVLYQQLESSYLTPKIMGNAVGLKPMIVLLGVMIFLILFGIVGGFVAVPLIVIIKILYEFYIDLQKLKAKGIV